MALNERTAEDWQRILEACGVRPATAQRHAPAFEAVLQGEALSAGEEELDDFLGQILHESGGLERMRENMNYSADAIRKLGFALPAGSRWRAAAEQADRLAARPGNQERLANFVYANRLGNGSEMSGDGWNFRGATHIQGTGRVFFEWAGTACGVDLIARPQDIEDPEIALRVSLAWWEGHVPDALSQQDDIVRVTKRVNGGVVGIKHREVVTQAAREAITA